MKIDKIEENVKPMFSSFEDIFLKNLKKRWPHSKIGTMYKRSMMLKDDVL